MAEHGVGGHLHPLASIGFWFVILALKGCVLFWHSMTELGHGSNVMGIETTAVYDEAAGEFVINTPTDTASKFWIGGAAQHGKARTLM